MEHHPIFAKFDLYEAEVNSHWKSFTGALFRSDYHILTEEQVKNKLPEFDEEYFEWIDILEAVANADEKFVMIELGAGYGRWLLNAAAGCKRNFPSLTYKLIGVEAEPTHFQWMEMAFRDNLIESNSMELINAAVNTSSEDAWFYIGKSNEWYGQRLALDYENKYIEESGLQNHAVFEKRNGEQLAKVKTITLNEILEKLEYVDIIDVDIQGTELEIVSCSIEKMNEKVKRVHIGTHSSEVERGLREVFTKNNWEKVFDFPCTEVSETPWGKIEFQDGVQSWKNTRLGQLK